MMCRLSVREGCWPGQNRPTKMPPHRHARRRGGRRDRYASVFGAKRVRAASATSRAIAHVVFLAATSRVWCWRKYARSRFGSTFNSAASAVGVIVVGVAGVSSCVMRGAPFGVTCIARDARRFDLMNTSYTRVVMNVFAKCNDCVNVVARSSDAWPPRGPRRRGILTWRPKSCRAKRAGCTIFSHSETTCAVSHAC